MVTKTLPWNVANHLKTEADMAGYLEACFEEDDPALVADALNVIARARGLAVPSGIPDGTFPGHEISTLATLFEVTKSLGLKLFARSRHAA